MFKEESPILSVNTKRILTQGRKIVTTSEDILHLASLYFEWVESNPLYEHKWVVEGGIATEKSTPLKRAMSIKGLCIHIGVTSGTWRQWRKVPELQEAVEYVEDCIATQKFEGAAAGQLNAGFIARDLGMTEKTMIGSDPDNPLPQQVAIFQLPDNGRGPVQDPYDTEQG